MELLEVANYLITPGSCVLDIGAHKGAAADTFAALAQSSGEVHAFEPHPVLFFELSMLCSVAEQKKIAKMFPYCKAMSDSVGHVIFSVSRFMDQVEFNCASSIEQNLANEGRLGEDFIRILVETDTIDTFCRNRFVAPTVIKIDTEGADYRVIRGAQKTIERYRPAIITEFGYDADQGLPTTALEPLSHLEKAGYELFVMDMMHFKGNYVGHDSRFAFRTILPISVEELSLFPGVFSFNVLALPRQSDRYDRSPVRAVISEQRAPAFLGL